MQLTETQLQTVLHAMRVSAERFESDAETMRALASNVAPSGLSEYSRLAEQFDRQARETRELADLCEDNGLAFVTLTCRNSLILTRGFTTGSELPGEETANPPAYTNLSNSDADFRDRD